jgi:hypothetical protein
MEQLHRLNRRQVLPNCAPHSHLTKPEHNKWTEQASDQANNSPHSPFLDPRGPVAAAATTSLGLLAPLRPAPSGGAGGRWGPREPAERRGKRGDAEHEEARTRLSMVGNLSARDGLSRSERASAHWR